MEIWTWVSFKHEVSRESSLSRAYREYFDESINPGKYAFLFEPDYAESQNALLLEKKRKPIPYAPPVDESFLKEIAKQVWASVLPENRE